MGTYTNMRKERLPTGYDELGLKYSLTRFDSETLPSFRRRLLLEARDPAGPTQEQFIRGVNRKVGLFEVPVFEIDVILDGSGAVLAPDPYVEITSTYLRAYSDYDNETLDFELNLVDRNDGYFLDAVNTAFTASTFFSITIIDTDHTYKRSDQLRYDNTTRVTQLPRLRNRYVNDLGVRHVKQIIPSLSRSSSMSEMTFRSSRRMVISTWTTKRAWSSPIPCKKDI